MEEQLISFNTAKLAKEKGFDIPCENFYVEYIDDDDVDLFNYEELRGSGYAELYRNNTEFKFSATTQSLLQKFIRETRGVHIEIHRNASGYYWSMCKADGGTDLGWSNISGPNDSGVWDSFESALENALQVQLSYDLSDKIDEIKDLEAEIDELNK